MITISIIIPVYKVEQYISRCVLSILKQVNCDVLIECIFVDDCTPDNSMKIIHSLVDQFKGSIEFKFLKHETNRGLSAARNTGIDAAKGDFILFVDSDDWLPSDSILNFVRILHKNPGIDMITGNDKRTKDVFPFNISRETIIDNYQLRKYLLNHKNISCTAWNKLVKSSLVSKNKFPEGYIFEDSYWTYFLFQDIKKAIIIPEVTYIYEDNHPLSIVNTVKSKDKVSIHMRSSCFVGNAIMDAPYKDLYVDCIFYLLDILIVALHLQTEQNYKNDDYKQIELLRKRIVHHSFKNGYWFSSLFISFLTYPPTSKILNIRWVRNHYLKIKKAGRVVANFLNRLHIHLR